MSTRKHEVIFACYGIHAIWEVIFGVIEVRFERGVYLPQQDFWLDPWDAKPFAFVSHAHSDHIAPHREVIVSERTARLMRIRLPASRIEHPLPFGERKSISGIDVMLIPAGHIFGSAQCLVFAGDQTLLYSGDFKLRAGRSAEQPEWRQADTLVWKRPSACRGIDSRPRKR